MCQKILHKTSQNWQPASLAELASFNETEKLQKVPPKSGIEERNSLRGLLALSRLKHVGQAATLVIYAGDGTTPHGPISAGCTESHIGDSEDVLAFILTSGRLRTYVEN